MATSSEPAQSPASLAHPPDPPAGQEGHCPAQLPLLGDLLTSQLWGLGSTELQSSHAVAWVTPSCALVNDKWPEFLCFFHCYQTTLKLFSFLYDGHYLLSHNVTMKIAWASLDRKGSGKVLRMLILILLHSYFFRYSQSLTMSRSQKVMQYEIIWKIGLKMLLLLQLWWTFYLRNWYSSFSSL